MFFIKKLFLFILIFTITTNSTQSQIKTPKQTLDRTQINKNYTLLINTLLSNGSLSKVNSRSKFKTIIREISFVLLPLIFPLTIATTIYLFGKTADKYDYTKEKYTFKEAFNERLTWLTGIPSAILTYFVIRITHLLLKHCSEKQTSNIDLLTNLIKQWNLKKTNEIFLSPPINTKLNRLHSNYSKNQNLNISENEAKAIINNIIKTVVKKIQNSVESTPKAENKIGN